MRERFIKIKGFSKNYRLSSKGYVVNIKTGRILKPFLFQNMVYVSLVKENGYPSVKGLHRLIIENFRNALPNDYAIHLDFDTTNNELPNVNKVNGLSALKQWQKNKKKINRCVYDNHFYLRGASKKPYKGILNINAKSIHVGYFKTKKETEQACAVVFKKIMGFEMSRKYK